MVEEVGCPIYANYVRQNSLQQTQRRHDIEKVGYADVWIAQYTRIECRAGVNFSMYSLNESLRRQKRPLFGCIIMHRLQISSGSVPKKIGNGSCRCTRRPRLETRTFKLKVEFLRKNIERIFVIFLLNSRRFFVHGVQVPGLLEVMTVLPKDFTSLVCFSI